MTYPQPVAENKDSSVKRSRQLLHGIVLGIFVLNVVLFLIHSRSNEKDKVPSRSEQSAGTGTTTTQANGSTH